MADSSFIIEGILKRKELLEEDLILTVDLAVHEVVNSLWKHQHVLKDLGDGLAYVSILYGLLESKKIRAVSPNEELMRRSYLLAARNKASIYDTVFVALALDAGLELATFDKGQATIMQSEPKM